jgi:hypothetical protein
MYEIRIPDQVYQQVAQAAEAQHVSLEEYVTEALQIHMRVGTDDAAIQKMFTPERLQHIAKAQAEIDAGQGIPFDQWRENFKMQRTARLKTLE